MFFSELSLYWSVLVRFSCDVRPHKVHVSMHWPRLSSKHRPASLLEWAQRESLDVEKVIIGARARGLG